MAGLALRMSKVRRVFAASADKSSHGENGKFCSTSNAAPWIVVRFPRVASLASQRLSIPWRDVLCDCVLRWFGSIGLFLSMAQFNTIDQHEVATPSG
jgi:hypothetical protein